MSLAAGVARAAAGSVVPTNDPVALAKALADYQDPARREAASRAALGLVAREFSTEAMGKQLVRIYERALA
jgi:glycosyltransferase involved in cell wall biosynthesis